MTYREWRRLVRSSGNNAKDFIEVVNFGKAEPYTSMEYNQRLDREKEEIGGIMAITDRVERINEIARNLELFTD